MNIAIYLIPVFIILIAIYIINKRPSQQPSDIELYNEALKAIIDNNHEKAFKILKDIIPVEITEATGVILRGKEIIGA